MEKVLPFSQESLRSRNTLKRKIFWLLYNFVLRHIPDIGPKTGIFEKVYKLRSWAMRPLLRAMGNNVFIAQDVVFTNAYESQIGDRTGIGLHSKLGTVIIGSDCMISDQCLIYSNNHKIDNLTSPIGDQGYELDQPVVIGNNVWIGGRVTITPGVNVGDGAVVGAGSVLTKDVKSNTVVAGNPAKFIRNRGASR